MTLSRVSPPFFAGDLKEEVKSLAQAVHHVELFKEKQFAGF
jgi:hypothetical protein